MKYIFSISLLLSASWFLGAQATFDLSFAEVSNDGSTYTVDALLSFTEDMDLATSNMVFNFNAAGLSDPVFEGTTDLNTMPVPFYTVSVTNPSVGRASINVVLNIQDFGDLVTSAPILLARITFTTIDVTESTNFVWRYDGDQATTGTVVFQDDPGQTATTLLNANVLTGLDRELDRALPVELSSFTGRVETKRNVLNWTTALEENFSHYELQRSADGAGDWTLLGAVAGAMNGQEAGTEPSPLYSGEGPGERFYAWTDETPLPAAYYRLRSVDLDGTFSLSEVVYLERTDAAEMIVFPNPTTGNFTAELTSDTDVFFTLLSVDGRRIFKQTVSPVGGRVRAAPASAGDLEPGVYLLVATSAGQRWTRRVVVR